MCGLADLAAHGRQTPCSPVRLLLMLTLQCGRGLAWRRTDGNEQPINTSVSAASGREADAKRRRSGREREATAKRPRSGREASAKRRRAAAKWPRSGHEAATSRPQSGREAAFPPPPPPLVQCWVGSAGSVAAPCICPTLNSGGGGGGGQRALRGRGREGGREGGCEGGRFEAASRPPCCRKHHDIGKHVIVSAPGGSGRGEGSGHFAVAAAMAAAKTAAKAAALRPLRGRLAAASTTTLENMYSCPRRGAAAALRLLREGGRFAGRPLRGRFAAASRPLRGRLAAASPPTSTKALENM